MRENYYQEDSGGIELAQARVVLGVGMGIGGPESLPEVRELAAGMGAVLATTRNVVHAGWLPHQVQVGISGRAIAPPVYLAVGIRGVFDHTVGVQKAGVIVAVNTNRRHPIFPGGGLRDSGGLAGVSAGVGGGAAAGFGGV